jgi:hypothetical protein
LQNDSGVEYHLQLRQRRSACAFVPIIREVGLTLQMGELGKTDHESKSKCKKDLRQMQDH